MTENNGWSCCGIPSAQNDDFDWRAKVLAEALQQEEAAPSPQAPDSE